jgi:hypothetical protein
MNKGRLKISDICSRLTRSMLFLENYLIMYSFNPLLPFPIIITLFTITTIFIVIAVPHVDKMLTIMVNPSTEAKDLHTPLKISSRLSGAEGYLVNI